MKKCARKKCGKDFEPKKPRQKFCSPNCRVYNKRDGKEPGKRGRPPKGPEAQQNFDPPKPPEVKVNQVSELKKAVYNPYAKTLNAPPIPTRLPGEDPFDFAARKNEWKKKYNQ